VLVVAGSAVVATPALASSTIVYVGSAADSTALTTDKDPERTSTAFSITGRLVDHDGRPVADQNLPVSLDPSPQMLLAAETDENAPGGLMLSQVRAGDDGSFRPPVPARGPVLRRRRAAGDPCHERREQSRFRNTDRNDRRRPRSRWGPAPAASRIIAAALEPDRRKPRAAGTRTSQARIARLGTRRRAAPTRHRGADREPDRAGGHCGLQGRVRPVGQRLRPEHPAGPDP
jgi:hypothetical protein